jgi:hypothetical protein
MSEKEVKRQHYVPRTYLKQFSFQKGDENYISVLPKSKCEVDNIYQTNIINVCLQTDFYTLPGDTAEERMLIEKFYSENYESQYYHIYQLLTDPKKTILNDVERELIISTIVTMFYRTSKWVSVFNSGIKRVYEQMYYLCNQTGKDFFNFDGKKISIKDKTLDEIFKEHKLNIQPYQVLSQLQLALKLIKLRTEKDGIYVIKLEEDDCEFITSDNPVGYYNIDDKHIMPFDPTNVLKLPIDKKHIVYLMPYSNNQTKYQIARNNQAGSFCYSEALTSNYEQFRNSERFILGDESSLKIYLATKEIAERPLTNEQNEAMKTMNDIIKTGIKLGVIK